MLEVRDVPGKGRGVFAARLIKGGEVVLREQPTLLYPQQSTAAAFCSYCLRAFNSLGEGSTAVVPCNTCGRVGFCSPACTAAAAADPGSHCAAVCALLAACNTAGLSDEQHTALQFLARCCSLRAAAAAGDTTAAARLASIAALAAPATLPPSPDDQQRGESLINSGSCTAGATSEEVVRELHGRLSHALAAVGAPAAAALSLADAAELLRREGANGYGIMAPSAPDGERRIRGTGLYAQASLVNHECLPNVARFDCFDSGAGGAPGSSTSVELRALHDIPAGEEVTQSYFPLPWPLAERQQRCRDDYGFECACPRCKEEATWSEGDSEWEIEGDEGMEDAAASPQGEAEGSACGHVQPGQQQAPPQQAEGGGGVDPAYINIFLLKFVCPVEGCGGTLAPLPPPGATDHFECNMCGRRRTEAEFMAELQADE